MFRRIAVMGLSAAMLASCASRSLSTETATAVDRMISEAYPNEDEPGCSVVVARNGRVELAATRGLANVETGDRIAPETNFRIASVSKQFTALAVLKLVDAGTVSLDDPLTRWFPELAPWADAATVRDLLRHTSGLKDYENFVPDDAKRQVLDADVLRLLAKNPGLDFEPGTKYSYSNSGYALLALLVERATQRRFADYLREEIFAPAGMENTLAYEDGISVVPHRAYGHKRREGESAWRVADQSTTSAVLGDGGIYSSTLDYVKWDAALREEGKLLSPGLLEEAYTAGKLKDGSALTYGYGWNVEEAPYGKVVWHTGSTSGFNHAARRLPSEGLVVVVLANRPGTEPKELCEKIMGAVAK